MYKRALFLSILFVWIFAQADAQVHHALVLSPIPLLQDSSFASETVGLLKKSAVVEILEKSGRLHEDKTQTQQFHWYKVKDDNDNVGWAMGDELAILHLSPEKFVGISHITGAPYAIGKGFEKSIFFWGETSGKDDLSSHFSAQNEYHENYLVFISPNNKTKFLPVGTQSERGKNTCIGLYFADLTKNGYQEIIVYRSLTGKEMDEEVRKLEIYQLVEGEFKIIFEQRLNLYFEPGVTSPGRFKFVDINADGIRLEYPSYKNCKKTEFGVPIPYHSAAYQKTLSWVSESYTWDKINNKFSYFYKPSSLPYRAQTRQAATFLREKPDLRSASIVLLRRHERLKIIAHLENITIIKNRKVPRIFFLVKTSDGTVGYLPSEQIQFMKAAHASILNQFYARPLLIKRNWKKEASFIRLRGFDKETFWEVTGNFTE